ncbi:MAG: hypothetical protein ABH864_07035 [archaeon]
MASVTISVPEETRKLMKKFSEINWSGFVKKAIEEQAQRLEWKEKMLSKLKEEQAFNDWAVQTQKKSGKERLKELKKKGLL